MINILPEERKIFTNAIAAITESFKAQSAGDRIDTIGLDTVGLATLIAHWDVEQSGTSSGAWFRVLETAVSVALAKSVLDGLEQMVSFAERVYAKEAFNSSTAIEGASIETSVYSAREITQKQWQSGRLPKDAFDMDDSRDPGYCGTLAHGCTSEVKSGYYYTRNFRRCFEVLFWGSQPQEDVEKSLAESAAA